MHRSICLARLGCPVAIFVATIGSFGLPGFADKQAHADEWRRTANGWERREDWYLESVRATSRRRDYFTSDQQRAPAPRWDFHPAALVAIQAVSIAAAFGLAKRSGVKLPAATATNGVTNAINKRGRQAQAA